MKALNRAKVDPTTLVMVSHICAHCFALIDFHWSQFGPEEAQRRWVEAVIHLNVCPEVHATHHTEYIYFLHGRPVSATSWKESGGMHLAGMSERI